MKTDLTEDAVAYLPLGLGILLAAAALILFGVPVGLCLILCVAAGAAQDIPGEWGFSPDELIYGLVACVPPLVTLITTLRIFGNITLNSLAGGLAVPVYAQVLVVKALSAGADNIAGSGPNPEE